MLENMLQLTADEFDSKLVEVLLEGEPSDKAIIELVEAGGCQPHETRLVDYLLAQSKEPKTLRWLATALPTRINNIRQQQQAIDALLAADATLDEGCQLLDCHSLLATLRKDIVNKLIAQELTVQSARAILYHSDNPEEQARAARYLLQLAVADEIRGDLLHTVLSELVVRAPGTESREAWQRLKQQLSGISALNGCVCALIEDNPARAQIVWESIKPVSLMAQQLVHIVVTAGLPPTVRDEAYAALAPRLSKLNLDDLLAVSTAAGTTSDPTVTTLVATSIREWRSLRQTYQAAVDYPPFAAIIFTHLMAIDVVGAIYRLKRNGCPALRDWLKQLTDPGFTVLFERRSLGEHGLFNLLQLFPERLAALVTALHIEEANGFTCLVGAYCNYKSHPGNRAVRLDEQLKPFIDEQLAAGGFGPADARTLAVLAHDREFAERAKKALKTLPLTSETLRDVARCYSPEELRAAVLRDPELRVTCLLLNDQERRELLFP